MMTRGFVFGWLLTAAALILSTPLGAQTVQPSAERLELPDYQSSDEEIPSLRFPFVPDFVPEDAEQADSSSVLPALDFSQGTALEGLAAGGQVRIDRIEFSGNHSLTDAQLAEVTRRFEGRALGYAELQSLQDALTSAYVVKGYVNSGAVIPVQKVRAGVLKVEIIEGTLSSVEIRNAGRLRESVIRKRLASVLTGSLNVLELEEKLQLLQLDPQIETVNAALAPSDQRGLALLQLEIVEANPWIVELEVNNFSTPLVGEWRGVAVAGHRNLLGFGDTLRGEYKVSEGLHDVTGLYFIPFTRWGTRFEIYTRHTWSSVVEAPFSVADIESRTQTYGLGLVQPIHRTPSTSVELFIRGEWRRSKAQLLDRPLPVNGQADGVNKVVPLRLGVSFSQRSSKQVLAMRSMVSIGLDILKASRASGNTPDGKFVSWLTQMQYARQLSFLNAVFVARGDCQLSDRPLVGLERAGIGGHASVRGYRENQIVGDQGVVGSVEMRFPITIPKFGVLETDFELAVFLDAGHSWNAALPDPLNQNLVSVGLGGRWTFNDRIRVVAYWAQSLIDVPNVFDDSLQQNGFHLGVRFRL